MRSKIRCPVVVDSHACHLFDVVLRNSEEINKGFPLERPVAEMINRKTLAITIKPTSLPGSFFSALGGTEGRPWERGCN